MLTVYFVEIRTASKRMLTVNFVEIRWVNHEHGHLVKSKSSDHVNKGSEFFLETVDIFLVKPIISKRDFLFEID